MDQGLSRRFVSALLTRRNRLENGTAKVMLCKKHEDTAAVGDAGGSGGAGAGVVLAGGSGASPWNFQTVVRLANENKA